MYLADLGIFGRLIIGSRDTLQPATLLFGILRGKEKRSFYVEISTTIIASWCHAVI